MSAPAGGAALAGPPPPRGRCTPRSDPGHGVVLALLAGGALWLPLLERWRRAWSLAPDQAYGWAVPVLAVFLVWERARWAPAPRPPGRSVRWAAALVLAGGLAIYAGALLVLEANILWPTPQWAGALAAIAVTLAALAWAGGTAWAFHFILPLGFVVTALTWPTPIKVWIVDHLVSLNATLAAEAVSVLGHPAVVSGNVISVGTGLIGVDEACSGLRSLQAVAMAAYFFGEFYRLNGPRRLGLFAASFGAAWAANVVRTTVLTELAAADGLATSERWHDRAGYVELIVALAAVFWLASKAASPRPPPPPATPVAGLAPPAWGPVAAIVLGVGLLAEVGTGAWYARHERHGRDAGEQWALQAPDHAWTPMAVPPRAVAVLQSSAAAGLAGSDPRTGARAWVFLVTWDGSAAEGENPEWHDPTICLPAAGVQQVADWGATQVVVDGLNLPFTGYAFAAGGRPLAVFFCHWDADVAHARAEGDLAPGDLRARRWRRVAEGRRQGNVAHLTFLLETADHAAAVRWLQATAPAVLQVRSPVAAPGS